MSEQVPQPPTDATVINEDGTASAARARSLANLRMWKPGQSGNPKGLGGASPLMEAMRIARESSPKAMMTLVELLTDEDSRVRAVAANGLLDRAMGKPKEKPAERTPPAAADFSQATGEELAVLRKVFGRMASAASVMPEGEAEK